jgi:hypothetical protein
MKLSSHLKKRRKNTLNVRSNGFQVMEQVGRTGPVWKMGTSGKGEDIRKGWRRVNMVENYVHVYVKGKRRLVETNPGMGRERIKNDRGGEFKYGIL